MDDWRPMTEDFNSISFNSYSRGPAAQLPPHLLPAFSQFGCNSSQLKRNQNLKLFIDGFPSDLTENGLKNFLRRIGCNLLSVKIVHNKSRLGRPFGFVDFESAKEAQRAIELIKSQNNYKLFVSFTLTENDCEEKGILIENEKKEFQRLISKQLATMRPKISLGNDSVINGSNSTERLSPISSESGSQESSLNEVLTSVAKSDKLLKIMQNAEGDCSVCNSAEAVEHLHYILSEQQVVDPLKMPELIDCNISCLACGAKTIDLKLCSQCKTATYCSRKCQSTNWTKHRPLCKPESNESFLQFNSTSIPNKSFDVLNDKRNESKLENKVNQTQIASTTQTPIASASRSFQKESTPVINDTSGALHDHTNDVYSNRSDILTDVSTKSSALPSVAVNTTRIPVNDSAKVDKYVERNQNKTKGKITIEQCGGQIEYEQLVDGEEDVVICFGRNPFDFYLQKSTSYEKMDAFTDQLSKKVKDFPQIADKNLKIGALCGGIYSADGVCYRARIVDKVGDDTYALYFIDYGNTEPVKLIDIKALPSLFFDCKAQAIHCSLANIDPIEGNWNKNSSQLFGEIGERNEFTKVKIIEKTNENFYKIDLINKSGESIRNAFVEKNFATIPETNDNPSTPLNKSPAPSDSGLKTPVQSPQATPKKLDSNSSSPVVLNSPKVTFNKSSLKEMERNYRAKHNSSDATEKNGQLLSVLDKYKPNDTIELLLTEPLNESEVHYFSMILNEYSETVMRDITKDYNESGVQYTPKVYDIVVVLSEGDYFRALVLDVNESTARVFYIDSGIVESDVIHKNIFKMIPKYRKYDAMGVLIVPRGISEQELVQISASRDTPVLEGIFVKRNDKTFIETSNQLIEIFGYNKAIEFMNDAISADTTISGDVTIDAEPTVDTNAVIDYYLQLPTRKLELNKRTELLVVFQSESDPNIFFAAGNGDALSEVMGHCAKLKEKFANIKINPKAGKVYLVRSVTDNEWYRALVLSANDNKCTVVYVDFGNQEDINANYMMELTPELEVSTLTPVAIRCKVHSSDLSTEDLRKKIEKACDGTYLLKVEPIRTEDGFHLVKVF